jgi:hypothetical protein
LAIEVDLTVRSIIETAANGVFLSTVVLATITVQNYYTQALPKCTINACVLGIAQKADLVLMWVDNVEVSGRSTLDTTTTGGVRFYNSTVEKKFTTVQFSTANNTSLVVQWKGGTCPPSPTLSLRGKARCAPPIPVGPCGAWTLPLRGGSSTAPTLLPLLEGGNASRTGAVAGVSSSGAIPATLSPSGVDARCRHYFCGGDGHRTLSLPHGRELRPAVPHSLVPPSGEGKAPALCSLGLQGGQGGELALRACLARIVRCLQGTCSTSVPGGPRGGGRVRCGLAHPYNVSPLPVTVFTKPLVPRTGSVAEGCGVLSESPTDTILSRGSGQNTYAELPGSHGQPPDVEGRRAKGPLPRDTIAGQ